MALSLSCASFNLDWYNLSIMRYVTTIYIFLTIPHLAPVHAADLSANKPNIIFILAEDSGFADFGCYGHPYSRTPNIDKLAADGTRFTQFYATGVSCCPRRTGLMTSLVGHDAANNKWNHPFLNSYYQCDWPDVEIGCFIVIHLETSVAFYLSRLRVGYFSIKLVRA